MLKSTLAFGSLAILLTIAPAQAQKMTCSDAEFTAAEAGLAKMDANKKDGMAQEIKMAKEMMAKKDAAGCMTHMENAMKMMPKP